jgi:UDP-N-acetylglucosamine 2-epimerase (non-hydrolysing)
MQTEKMDLKVCVTSQHRQMLDQVLDFFQIQTNYDLDLMSKGQSLNTLAARILIEFDKVLEKENPEFVLVHGDTTTSSICALAAFHRGIKIGHVEAGLRTYDLQSPFPEEFNRQLTSKIATFHFAPTNTASDNLKREGVVGSQILITGNTVIDSLLMGLELIDQGSYFSSGIDLLNQIIDPNKKIILVTGHRRENFGRGFIDLCEGIKKIAIDHGDVQIIYPVHLNPNVQRPVNDILSGFSNIKLIEPLDYPAFIYLMRKSYLILTDSGGVQEEAPSLGKPVLVMRNTTERPEAVEAGTVRLVGTDTKKITDEVNRLLENKSQYQSMSQRKNPYGDGLASHKITSFLKNV